MNFEKAFELREKKGLSNEFNEVILMKRWSYQRLNHSWPML